MPTLTIKLPVQKNQTAFNLRRWEEILSDSDIGRELAKVEGRVETDRHGYIIMSPPPGFTHGNYQSEIAFLLKILLSHGRVTTECPISTADGVRASDVAWISKERLAKIGEKVCLTKAPELCVEVLSRGNTRREMAERKALFFAAGAREVWFCEKGRMTFFVSATSTGQRASRFCPEFPNPVVL